MPDEHGGISREEAEAMGLIDHAEEARVHAHAVERLTELEQREDQTARHDGLGVEVIRAVGYQGHAIYTEYEPFPENRHLFTPGKWFPTSAEALAEVEKVVQDAVSLATSGTLTGTQEREIRDHVLRALGLTT